MKYLVLLSFFLLGFAAPDSSPPATVMNSAIAVQDNLDNTAPFTFQPRFRYDTTAQNLYVWASGEWDTMASLSGSTFSGNWYDLSGIPSEFQDGTVLPEVRADFGSSGGDISGFQSPVIGADAVTYDKMQDASSGSILIGRGGGSGGTLQEISLGSGLSMSGTTLSAAASGAASASNYLVSSTNVVAISDGASQITVVKNANGDLTFTVPDGVEHFDLMIPSEYSGANPSDDLELEFVFQGSRVYNQSELTMRYPRVEYVNRDGETFTQYDVYLEGNSPQKRLQPFTASNTCEVVLSGVDVATRWTVVIKF